VNVSVMVFTRDLRLADNPALAAAARAPAVVPLFVLDEAILRRASARANRLGFLLDSLRDLDSGLRKAGGALVLRAGPWAETVLATAQAAGAGRIHVADDVSCYATSRLGQLERDAGERGGRGRVTLTSRTASRVSPNGGTCSRWNAPDQCEQPVAAAYWPGDNL
jgi:deoxyribodipyrimidine photo-lyase